MLGPLGRAGSRPVSRGKHARDLKRQFFYKITETREKNLEDLWGVRGGGGMLAGPNRGFRGARGCNRVRHFFVARHRKGRRAGSRCDFTLLAGFGPQEGDRGGPERETLVFFSLRAGLGRGAHQGRKAWGELMMADGEGRAEFLARGVNQKWRGLGRTARRRSALEMRFGRFSVFDGGKAVN